MMTPFPAAWRSGRPARRRRRKRIRDSMKRLVLPGRHARIEAAAVDGQRERALGFLAGAHAAVADDALRRVVGEIRIGFVLLQRQVVGALVAVAHVAQADRAGHVLQFAVAVGRAGQAIERVIGDVEFHHAAAQIRAASALCVRTFMPGSARRGAGGRIALAGPRFRPGTAGTSRTAPGCRWRTAWAR